MFFGNRLISKGSLIVGLAFLLLLAGTAQSQDKAPVPSVADQQPAEKLIKDTFKEEYAAKTPAGQQKLAKRLLDQAKDSKDNDSVRYVLLREATEIGAKSGDLDTVLRASDEICNGYATNPIALKETLLAKVESAISAPEDLKRLCDAQLKLSQEAADLDQFDNAAKAAQSALSLGKKAKDMGLTARADGMAKVASEMKAGLEKAKKAEQTLATASEDPGANQALGEWYCLSKGQWEKGLKHLALGSDAVIKGLATKELSRPTEFAPQLEIADGWWDLGEREKNATRKKQMIAHARSFYDVLHPKATGLAAVKIGKRLESPREAIVKDPVLPASKDEQEAMKAEIALASNPEDAGSHLTLGKYLAFTKDQWATALPHLAKGSDATLKNLAEKELGDPKIGPEQIAMGDAWMEALRKLPALRKSLQDRAVYWYAQAWPSLEGPLKDKLRDRLRKTFQGPASPLSKSPPKEWSNPTPEAKAGTSSMAPYSGRTCFQINCAKIRDGTYVPVSQSVMVKPGAQYELSCWVLTDDTNSTDDMLYAPVFSQDNKLVLHPSVNAIPDQPWFKKISVKFTGPDTATRMTVQFGVISSKGTIFIDDISLKQDGKEVIKNGSFEQ